MMDLQSALVEETTDWLVVLFSAVVGPSLLVGRGSKRLALWRLRSRVLAPPRAAPPLEAAASEPVTASAPWQRPQPGECDAEGYPVSLGVQHLPARLPTTFLTEASVRELTAARRAAPRGTLRQVARERWLGQWVRWGGEVAEIAAQASFVTVMVVDSRGGFVYLHFPPSQRTVVEPLREGDRIVFVGQILKLADMCVDLVRVDLSVSQSVARTGAVRR